MNKSQNETSQEKKIRCSKSVFLVKRNIKKALWNWEKNTTNATVTSKYYK